MNLEDLVDIKEAARLLHLSVQTLYTDGCKSGAHRFPYYRVGGKRLYSKSELSALIAERRVATNQELKQEAKRSIQGAISFSEWRMARGN